MSPENTLIFTCHLGTQHMLIAEFRNLSPKAIRRGQTQGMGGKYTEYTYLDWIVRSYYCMQHMGTSK